MVQQALYTCCAEQEMSDESTRMADITHFSCHRKLRPMTQKNAPRDRTAAEWKSVAKATRRRRRILRAGFYFVRASSATGFPTGSGVTYWFGTVS